MVSYINAGKYTIRILVNEDLVDRIAEIRACLKKTRAAIDAWAERVPPPPQTYDPYYRYVSGEAWGCGNGEGHGRISEHDNPGYAYPSTNGHGDGTNPSTWHMVERKCCDGFGFGVTTQSPYLTYLMMRDEIKRG